MEDNQIEKLKNFLGIKPESMLDDSIDVLMQSIPYISKIVNIYKWQRLKRRLIEFESKLDIIGNKFDSIDKDLKVFIQSKIFPYVLDDLIEENQDEKIQYLLNGFEFVIDEQINDEAYIISCYDVLRELRIEDIKRLLEYTREYQRGIGKEIAKNRRELKTNDKEMYYKDESYRKHIDYKLESKGLIGNDKERQIEQISGLVNQRYYSRDKHMTKFRKGVMDSKLKRASETRLTRFGSDLINIFNLEILTDEIK